MHKVIFATNCLNFKVMDRSNVGILTARIKSLAMFFLSSIYSCEAESK
jgi:hypothetical protein